MCGEKADISPHVGPAEGVEVGGGTGRYFCPFRLQRWVEVGVDISAHVGCGGGWKGGQVDMSAHVGPAEGGGRGGGRQIFLPMLAAEGVEVGGGGKGRYFCPCWLRRGWKWGGKGRYFCPCWLRMGVEAGGEVDISAHVGCGGGWKWGMTG